MAKPKIASMVVHMTLEGNEFTGTGPQGGTYHFACAEDVDYAGPRDADTVLFALTWQQAIDLGLIVESAPSPLAALEAKQRKEREDLLEKLNAGKPEAV